MKDSEHPPNAPGQNEATSGVGDFSQASFLYKKTRACTLRAWMHPNFMRGWHGWSLEVDADEGTEFTLSIAKNELNLDGVIEWIRRHAKGEG